MCASAFPVPQNQAFFLQKARAPVCHRCGVAFSGGRNAQQEKAGRLGCARGAGERGAERDRAGGGAAGSRGRGLVGGGVDADRAALARVGSWRGEGRAVLGPERATAATAARSERPGQGRSLLRSKRSTAIAAAWRRSRVTVTGSESRRGSSHAGLLLAATSRRLAVYFSHGAKKGCLTII
jgi:hypothetical protein